MEKEAEKRPGEMAPFSKSLSYKHEDLPEFESPPPTPKECTASRAGSYQAAGPRDGKCLPKGIKLARYI